jgi:hypothetical protein
MNSFNDATGSAAVSGLHSRLEPALYVLDGETLGLLTRHVMAVARIGHVIAQ